MGMNEIKNIKYTIRKGRTKEYIRQRVVYFIMVDGDDADELNYF